MVLNAFRNLVLLGLMTLTCISFEVNIGKCVTEAGIPEDPVVKLISRTFKVGVEEVQDIVDLVFTHAPPHGFPTPLDVLAVIAVESSFQANAIHAVGPSVGPMQINIKAHGAEAGRSLEQNVRTGVRLLLEYRKKETSDSRAFVAYNAGPAKVRKICGKKVKCEADYAKKVSEARKKLAKAFEPHT